MSIKIKTQSEINLMRESGHILANVFKEVGKIVQAGISTKELDKFVYSYIRKNKQKRKQNKSFKTRFINKYCIFNSNIFLIKSSIWTRTIYNIIRPKLC